MMRNIKLAKETHLDSRLSQRRMMTTMANKSRKTLNRITKLMETISKILITTAT